MQSRDILLDLMARNLNLPNPGQRFDWTHRRNPDGGTHAWLLEHQGKIVASCSGIPRRYRHRQGPRNAMILADVNSDPDFRFALPALVLQRRIRDDFLSGEVGADFLLCGPIPSLAVVQVRAGMTELGKLTRYSKPVSVKRLRKMGRKYSLPTAVAADLVLGIQRAIQPRRDQDVVLLTDPVGGEFDQLDRELDFAGNPFRPARSSGFLHWRFEQHPFQNHEFLALKRGGELCGYLVLSNRHDGVLMIVDVRARNKDDFLSLCAAAERRALDSGAGALWINLVDGSALYPWIQKVGFKPRAQPMRVTAQIKDEVDCPLDGSALMDCDFDV